MDENKKPRICEILGVEPMEEWRIKDDPDNKLYRFNGNGREVFRAGQWMPRELESNLLRLIENPNLIQHKPRWTKDDVEDAKAVLKIFPAAKYLYKSEDNDSVKIGIQKAYASPRSIWTDTPICPSLKPGEKVRLVEILEAEK